jgi:hypothetical protein
MTAIRHRYYYGDKVSWETNDGKRFVVYVYRMYYGHRTSGIVASNEPFGEPVYVDLDPNALPDFRLDERGIGFRYAKGQRLENFGNYEQHLRFCEALGLLGDPIANPADSFIGTWDADTAYAALNRGDIHAFAYTSWGGTLGIRGGQAYRLNLSGVPAQYHWMADRLRRGCMSWIEQMDYETRKAAAEAARLQLA